VTRNTVRARIARYGLRSIAEPEGVTNLPALRKFDEAARTFDGFNVLAQFFADYDLPELSVGGGLGVAYVQGEEPFRVIAGGNGDLEPETGVGAGLIYTPRWAEGLHLLEAIVRSPWALATLLEAAGPGAERTSLSASLRDEAGQEKVQARGVGGGAAEFRVESPGTRFIRLTAELPAGGPFPATSPSANPMAPAGRST